MSIRVARCYDLLSMKITTILFLAIPLQAAVVTNIQMTASAAGSGPQSSCAYSGPSPAATCTVTGSMGEGQAQASVNGSLISVGAGGSGTSSFVYVTATLNALYYTAFTGNLLAKFDYQCTAGGNVASGWAGMGSTVCGTSSRSSSLEEAVTLPVQALGGQIQLSTSWFAAVSTLGDQEYATSNLAFLGFQDDGGNSVAATAVAATAGASFVPEPATWGFMAVGLALLVSRRRNHRAA